MNAARRKLDLFERQIYGYDFFRWNWACHEAMKGLGLKREELAPIRADLKRLDSLLAEGIEGEPEPLTEKFFDKLREFLYGKPG